MVNLEKSGGGGGGGKFPPPSPPPPPPPPSPPTYFSRVPNVGKCISARFIGKVCRISLFVCKKARGIQKSMLSLSEITTSWSNFDFLQKNSIQSSFWRIHRRFCG